MPKEKSSKLDQYAAALLTQGDEKKTLDEMVAWLREEGVTVAKSTLSEFLEKQRQLRAQSQLLSSIASGAEQCKTVELEFAKNPAPELETLIKLHRVIILNITTLGQASPELLKLADQMTSTVLLAISARTKAAFKEREVSLAERKAADAKKTDQEKALELCLEEANRQAAGGNHLAKKLFKEAFAALKTGSATGQSTPQ